MIKVRDPSEYPTSWYDTDITQDPYTIYYEQKLLTMDGENRIVTFGVKLNPTDQRAFRMIVSAQDSKDARFLFNRLPEWWCSNEILSTIQDLSKRWCRIMAKQGLFPQQEFAGNNSQSTKDGVLYLGEKEPSFPHFHIINRQVEGFKLGGLKEFEYVGPVPGELFDMRKGKIRWDSTLQMELIQYLRKKIVGKYNT